MPNITSFLSSGKAGDIIAAIPAMKSAKTDVIIYIRLDAISQVDGIRTKLMDMKTFSYLKPLLMKQPFIKEVKVFAGQKVDYNLDEIRQMKIGVPYGNLPRWYFYAFPELACDLSVPFIECEKYDWLSDNLLVNLTPRYRNEWIDYSFLNHLDIPIHAIGTKDEAQAFINIVPSAKWLQCTDFLDMANCINSCKAFLGNQSAPFWIAEGLKVPRILEVFPYAPNCIGSGSGFYDFHTQKALEYYVKRLFGN
jgi:hypothetical protein